MKERLYQKILINFITTFLIGLLNFLVNKYFAENMGVENLGLMKLFTQLVQYLSVMEIGIGGAATYALYRPLSEKNIKKISIIISTMKLLYKKVFFLILVIGIIITPFIPRLINNQINLNDVYLYWILYVVNTGISYLFISYSILFIANQEYSYVKIVQCFTKVLYQLLQIYVVLKYHSFLMFIILLIFDNITQYIFYKFHYKKYYFYIFKTNLIDKEIFKNLKNLFWHKLGGLVVFNTDLILLSKFVSLEIVGIYASYQMIEQIIVVVLNITLNVLRPIIGKFITERSKEDSYLLYKKLNVLFLSISLTLSIITFTLINKFITLWMGEEYLLSKLTVILICINLFIRCFRGVTDVFKDGSGFFSDTYMPLLEAIINFIFSFYLVIKIGINGVIIGTLISNIFVICFLRNLITLKKCFNKDFKEYIIINLKYIIYILISIYFNYFILKEIEFSIGKSWKEWLQLSIITSSCVGSINFIIFSIDKDFRLLLKENIKINKKNNIA